MRHPIYKILFLSLLLSVGHKLFAQRPSKKAVRYFEKVADIIQNNYYFIDSINFSALKLRAKTSLSNAKSTEDTYPAIDTMLYNLHDKHSYFWKSSISNKLDSLVPLKYPTGYTLSDNIGYIKIPAILGHDNLAQVWADYLRNIYDKIESDNLKGWIIDLRGNFGGSMQPMLTGLYPFFGDTVIATVTIRNVGKHQYQFQNGYLSEIFLDKPLLYFQSYKKGNHFPDRRKVAVLIDNKVASSGEITAIALIERPNTKFFGMQTAGIPTAVRIWTLSDGAFLGVVVGAFLDKEGKGYHSALKPSVYVTQRNDNSNSDETITKAVEYLLNK